MNLAYYVVFAVSSLGLMVFFNRESCMNIEKPSSSYAASAPLADRVTISSSDDVKKMFAITPADITHRMQEAIADAQERIDAIIAIPNEKRTYENTMQAFDDLCAYSPLAILNPTFELLSMVHPDATMRDALQEAERGIRSYLIDHVSNNKALYDAIKSYATTNASQENLSAEQQYYIEEVVRDYQRSGLDLPDDARARVAQIKKDIMDCSQAFEKNIATDNRYIMVPEEALAGLSADMIASLEKTEDGLYKLGIDYPTYFAVMETCTVEDTRKKLHTLFNNRGYPANEAVLKKVIALRDTLAKELGFASYAHLDISDQMAKDPEAVTVFLDKLMEKSSQKEQQEVDLLLADLPESISLTDDGKLKSWDIAFLHAAYKKKHFSLDEEALAAYFPLEQTLSELLKIYEEFMDVKLCIEPISGLWHDDVQLVVAYDTSDKVLGYFLLDLYPRANKYTHACHGSIIPSVIRPDGSMPPKVSLLICNFPKPSGDKPALLKRSDVKTFFHEFGHALHSLLGRTSIASYAGTSVKTDFVEMPSQMLEEWLYEKDMLKRVSSHYLTQEPLTDELIDTIVALKNFNAGYFVQRQGYLSMVSLSYYLDGADKDVAQIMKDLYIKHNRYVAYNDATNMYASFGHLTGYGSKYYGYMWARVFGLDLFENIKQHGLGPDIGKKYVSCVLSKGGTQDPMNLLVSFLGREPQQDAFFTSLGL